MTFGHRFHAPQPITLKSAEGYESRLRRAKVVADFAARRELIRAGVDRGGRGGPRKALPALIEDRAAR